MIVCLVLYIELLKFHWWCTNPLNSAYPKSYLLQENIRSWIWVHSQLIYASTHKVHIALISNTVWLFWQNVYVQITNENGSTTASPVVVQASVMRGFGSLLPQRLKQLAQTITGSVGRNLGLDNSVFGRVKEVRLSTFMKKKLHASSPSPSPAPSPQLSDHSEPSSSPHPASPYSPISPPTAEPPPCFDCEVSSPAPSIVPPDPCPYSGFVHHPISSPKSYSKPSISPDYSPSAAPTSNSASHTAEEASDLSHGSKRRQGQETSKKLVSQILAPSSICKCPWSCRLTFVSHAWLWLKLGTHKICIMLTTNF